MIRYLMISDISNFNELLPKLAEVTHFLVDQIIGRLQDHWGLFWAVAVVFGLWCLAGHMLQRR